MAADLAGMKNRVRVALADAGEVVWEDEAVEEGLRLAVGEYGLAQVLEEAEATPAVVKDLDGAVETTLPGHHESLVVWGAAGYCALTRAVDRAEQFSLGSAPAEMKAWGDARLREFKSTLGVLFPAYAGANAGSGESGVDPAKTAAEIALLAANKDLALANQTLAEANASLAEAQAARELGKEEREAAAAEQAAADRAAEAERLAELRSEAVTSPWGTWKDRGRIDYPDGYDRS